MGGLVGDRVPPRVVRPLLLAALVVSGRPHIPQGARGLFDTTVIGLAVAYIGYTQTVVTALGRHAPGQVLLDAIYPVLDAVALIVALSTGIGAQQFLPLPRKLFTASVLLALLLDIGYSRGVDTLGGGGHWLPLGWSLQAGLLVVAAVTAVRHPETSGRVRTLPGRWTTVLLSITCLNVLQTVASAGLAHRLTRQEVAVGALVVAALVARGVLANSEIRATAVGLEIARTEQERLAVTDGLTGLYNRRFFEEFLRLEADRAARQGAPLSLIVADLDHFKRVNDRHGHPAGDRVLVETARRLRAAVRPSDVVARYGGEEFVVVLPDTDAAVALEAAERCRRTLAASPVPLAGGQAAITGSFGVATITSIASPAVDDLVRAADRALYRAKSTGRDRVAPAGEWDFLDASDSVPVGQLDPIAQALLRAAELVDADQSPQEHSTAMARWAGVLAAALNLTAAQQQRSVLAARLHDVGKLAIPGSVLTSPLPLTNQEWTLMRTHPEHSEALLALSASIADLGPIVRAHHERFDGTGYPDHLAGAAIPVEARIIAVCDAWAAMRADRVYMPARTPAECRRQLREGRGAQFDPLIAETFLELELSGFIDDLGVRPAPASLPGRIALER